MSSEIRNRKAPSKTAKPSPLISFTPHKNETKSSCLIWPICLLVLGVVLLAWYPICKLNELFASPISTEILPEVSMYSHRKYYIEGGRSGGELNERVNSDNKSYHIIEMKPGTGWNPVFSAEPSRLYTSDTLDDIENKFFDDKNRVHFRPSILSTVSMLGFIRVTKSASSSILNYIGSGNNTVQTSDVVLNQELELSDDETSFYPCFLGKRKDSSDEQEILTPEKMRFCSHETYASLVNFWANSIYYQKESLWHPKEMQYTLKTFTMLRDPFDRLVSYFNYAHEIYPLWEDSATKAQNKFIKRGDFGGWLKKLHAENGSWVFDIPYQKNYIASDVERAISMIEGRYPRVLALASECFEASVLLLVERYPELFSYEAAIEYFKLPKSNVYHSAEMDKKLNMALLRKKAMAWFRDDFEFYEAVVAQFRLNLSASDIDSNIVAECYQRLESKNHK